MIFDPAARAWRHALLVRTAVLMLALALSLTACGGDGAPQAGDDEETEIVAPDDAWSVSLYLPDERGALSAVEQSLNLVAPSASASSEELALAGLTLVQALLEAESEGVLPAVPGEVSAERFDVGDAGVAYVDLGGTPPGLGTLGEILSVYSLVNTVVMNMDAVESVVLLWNGNQRETFAGHIDTTRSLKARPKMVRSGPVAEE